MATTNNIHTSMNDQQASTTINQSELNISQQEDTAELSDSELMSIVGGAATRTVVDTRLIGAGVGLGVQF